MARQLLVQDGCVHKSPDHGATTESHREDGTGLHNGTVNSCMESTGGFLALASKTPGCIAEEEHGKAGWYSSTLSH